VGPNNVEETESTSKLDEKIARGESLEQDDVVVDFSQPSEGEGNTKANEGEGALAAMVALQEETEGRLRKVSSAFKQAKQDLDWIKKRAAEERKEETERAKGMAVKRLFEPLQNLRRSIESLEKEDIDGAILEGLKLVQSSFMTGFNELGLREVPGYGSIFNPDHHEALTLMPVEKVELDNRVLQVFAAGYQVGGFLIEPAKVIVGKYTAPEAEEESVSNSDDKVSESEDAAE
jgi:molecular chaperone GrpE